MEQQPVQIFSGIVQNKNGTAVCFFSCEGRCWWPWCFRYRWDDEMWSRKLNHVDKLTLQQHNATSLRSALINLICVSELIAKVRESFFFKTGWHCPLCCVFADSICLYQTNQSVVLGTWNRQPPHRQKIANEQSFKSESSNEMFSFIVWRAGTCSIYALLPGTMVVREKRVKASTESIYIFMWLL